MGLGLGLMMASVFFPSQEPVVVGKCLLVVARDMSYEGLLKVVSENKYLKGFAGWLRIHREELAGKTLPQGVYDISPGNWERLRYCFR